VCLSFGCLEGGARFPEGLNNTFIALIPKIDNPQHISEFRPIGLCNVVYKIITKATVQRFKHASPELISPCQVSFVPGRLIGDNVVIMQEMLHTLHKKRNGKGYMAILSWTSRRLMTDLAGILYEILSRR